jgi:predicted TIM-barrel fold metal-dependent hydrolase
MDRDYHSSASWCPSLKRKPSEYVARQCWICCEPEEKTPGVAAQMVGEDRIIWASDYPHFDADSDCVAMIAKNAELSEKARRKILGENAAKLYNLP